MPPISEPPLHRRREPQPLGLATLADRDNPLAWKRATKHGKRGAIDLLAHLSQEEVARYILLASDQIKLEERWAGLKLGCALVGVVLTGFEIWQGVTSGFGAWTISGLGLGLLMGYWPWRVLRCRQMWQSHCRAACAEQKRREKARSA